MTPNAQVHRARAVTLMITTAPVARAPVQWMLGGTVVEERRSPYDATLVQHIKMS